VGYVISLLALLVNNIHDSIAVTARQMGVNVTDKGLHFIIIGIIGMVIYIITDILFKKLDKINVSVISFIYTLTVLIVIVVSIEIEQKITHRGNMEFKDIEAGLWGFFALFAVYVVIRIFIYLIQKGVKSRK
jgi:hypothetical protein